MPPRVTGLSNPSSSSRSSEAWRASTMVMPGASFGIANDTA